jgi:hypothetical protein
MVAICILIWAAVLDLQDNSDLMGLIPSTIAQMKKLGEFQVYPSTTF